MIEVSFKARNVPTDVFMYVRCRGERAAINQMGLETMIAGGTVRKEDQIISRPASINTNVLETTTDRMRD